MSKDSLGRRFVAAVLVHRRGMMMMFGSMIHSQDQWVASPILPQNHWNSRAAGSIRSPVRARAVSECCIIIALRQPPRLSSSEGFTFALLLVAVRMLINTFSTYLLHLRARAYTKDMALKRH